MEGWTAICRDCEWAQSMPERALAEHAKLVHERRMGHAVVLETPDSNTNRQA